MDSNTVFLQERSDGKGAALWGHCTNENAGSKAGVELCQKKLSDQAFGAQTEHHPFAATTFPGKIWHGRHSSPALPCNSAQLAQFCSGAGLLRAAGSTVDASWVYFIACAIGSSTASFGKSPARTSRPGCMKQPAAATADSWINLRRAILLNGFSLNAFAVSRRVLYGTNLNLSKTGRPLICNNF
jgi:hypothetical protein